MTLEELLAALEAAAEALEAKPEDAGLKAKFEAAKSAYEAKKAEADEGGDKEGGKPDESKLDADTKAYIAKLRKENASHRTKAKGLASEKQAADKKLAEVLKVLGITEEEKPEEKVKNLTQVTQAQSFRVGILELAVEHGIGKDSVEYFEFLVTKEAGKLEEGEELSEDALKEIVAKVGKLGKGKANTGAGTGQKPPTPGSSGEVTLDQFVGMSIMEKSDLYQKNPELYKTLMADARKKKKI